MTVPSLDLLDVLGEAERVSRTGSFWWEPGGRVVWSDQLFRNLGLEPRSVVPSGEVFFGCVHPDDRSQVKAWHARAATTGEIVAAAYRVIRPDGATRSMRGAGASTRDADGKILRLVGTVQDVTESEERMRHSAKMEAMGVLAAGLAHDFNNYLTIISANLSFLALDRENERSKAIGQIAHAVDQSSALTRQLLSFARTPDANRRVGELAALVAAAVGLLERMLGPPYPVKLAKAVRAGTRVGVDDGALEQVLINLAVNARDAMPEGGSIDIEVADEVVLAGAPEAPAGWARVSVTDHGVGIAPEHLPKIFDPYFTTKSKGRGTGLGLAVALEIARRHGGAITVKSQVGAGSTFALWLPVATEPRARSPIPEPSAVPLRARRPARILLVDDLVDVRESAARVLRAAGHEVLEAPDGNTALELVRRGPPPDLVLADVVMPVMSGPRLAEHLRAEAFATPVVFMTGYAELDVLDRLSKEARVIEKPFGPRDLVDAIDDVLAKASHAPAT